jgi:hypothetical protein
MKKPLLILVCLSLFALLPGCANYGKEKVFNGLELYRTDKVTDAEVDSLGNYLIKEKFANGNPKTVQLTKSGDTYQFRMVVKEGIDKDTAYSKDTKLFASELSAQVFKDAPLEIHLCDDHLETLKVIVADNYGTRKDFNGVELFHTKKITDAEADSLGNYLVKGKFADGNPKTVQLTKSGDTYQFRMVVKKGIDKDPDYLKTFKLFASQLSAGVFKGAPVEVLMCDSYFNTLVVVPMNDSAKTM